MLVSAFILQYISLFGFNQTGNFPLLSSKISKSLAFGLLILSFLLINLSLGWQIGIPIWLGCLTVFGIVHSFWLAMDYCPYKASIWLALILSIIYTLSIIIFG